MTPEREHDLIALDRTGETRAERRARQQRMKARRRRAVAVILTALLLLGGGTVLAIGPLRSLGTDLFGSEDYEGTGEEEVIVTIPPGASGREAASILVEHDVIASTTPFLDALEDSGASLQAGTYTMRTRMSGEAALELLLNPEAPRLLVVPEGFMLSQINHRMVEQGFEPASVDAALEQSPAELGLPEDFPSLEGLLFPASYEIRPGLTPDDMVQQMADRTRQELDDLGIADDEALEVLTLASLVEIESPGDDEVRSQVARVFLNRMGEHSDTNGLLQSDATVHYIYGSRSDASTTAEERQSDDPYNTYRHPGLPPGPINSPGRASVEAALNPADGPWQYFVAVNPDTGETRFAETYPEHQRNVELYQQWLREHRSGQDDGEG
ncbi:endolytic transglycosylase MltG [Sediminivirga luteola]|uniref:Endolytic murein transglycosylase n=1 Tax=Sediminivirga luteola TaxID=1774748 RepID=A0A8J2TYW5_9MICO|nr:endolytic transglycosylase MltG [Sediminivirga luteola]GGA17640.1 ABC transporter substrate-binding protein [Sediminivirga luteola]